MPQRASDTGSPPYASSSSWKSPARNDAARALPVRVAQAEQLAPPDRIAELVGRARRSSAAPRPRRSPARSAGAPPCSPPPPPALMPRVWRPTSSTTRTARQRRFTSWNSRACSLAVVARLVHQLLAVERPALHHDRRPDVPPHLGGELLGRDQLQVMAGIRLVRHHRGDRVPAVAAALAGAHLRLARIASGG